jgi:hypothetical protein
MKGQFGEPSAAAISNATVDPTMPAMVGKNTFDK